MQESDYEFFNDSNLLKNMMDNELLKNTDTQAKKQTMKNTKNFFTDMQTNFDGQNYNQKTKDGFKVKKSISENMNGSDFETVQDTDYYKLSGENFDAEDQGLEGSIKNKSIGLMNAFNTSFEKQEKLFGNDDQEMKAGGISCLKKFRKNDKQ